MGPGIVGASLRRPDDFMAQFGSFSAASSARLMESYLASDWLGGVGGFLSRRDRPLSPRSPSSLVILLVGSTRLVASGLTYWLTLACCEREPINQPIPCAVCEPRALRSYLDALTNGILTFIKRMHHETPSRLYSD